MLDNPDKTTKLLAALRRRWKRGPRGWRIF
jgi:hypothetical protein